MTWIKEEDGVRLQRPQSSKQSKRPEDQAVGAPGAPPTGTPVAGPVPGYIATMAGELESCDEVIFVRW